MSGETTLLASAGDDVKLWTVPELSPWAFKTRKGTSNSVCWSSKSVLLASAHEGKKLMVANVKGDHHSTVELDLEHEQNCVNFSSNSRYLLSGGKDKAVTIWDLKLQAPRKVYSDHFHEVTTASFNYSDTTIVSGTLKGDILLHDVVAGTLSCRLKSSSTEAIKDIRFSQFKKSTIAVASEDGTMSLWETATQQIVKAFDGEHKSPVTGVSFSPVNDMLLCSVGLDKKIIFYDVVGKKSVKVVQSDAPLTCVDFLCDGATVAVGSTNGKIYLYDLRSGSTPTKVVTAHKTSVRSVAFQPQMGQAPAKPAKPDKSSVSSKFSKSDFVPTDSTMGKEPSGLSKSVSAHSKSTYSLADHSVLSPLRNKLRKSLSTDNLSYEGAEEQNVEEDVFDDAVSIKSNDSGGRFSQSSSGGKGKGHKFELNKQNSSGSDKGTPEVKTSTKRQKFKGIKSFSVSDGGSESKLSSLQLFRSGTKKSSQGRLGSSSSVTGGQATALEGTQEEDDNVSELSDSTSINPLQLDFFRSLIEEAMDEHSAAVHRDIVNLQIEMLRQLHIQQSEIKQLVSQSSLNQELMKENEKLHEEIKRLKATY